MTSDDTKRFMATRLLPWLLGLAALAILFPTALKILFASENEISFDAGVATTTCSGMLADDSRPADNCVTQYRITLGNTGSNPQALIEIRLENAPEIWRLNSAVVDIVASAQRRASPRIDYAQRDGQTVITVEQLEPNRLALLHLAFLGRDSAEQIQQTSVTVVADGTVIQSDPHVTVLSRFLRNVLGLF